MKRTIYILLACTLLFACKNNAKRDMIAKTWHGDHLENSAMDSVFIEQQQFIDTIGQHTTPAENDSLYGTKNMDSLKKELQLRYDTVKNMQEQTVRTTVFQFNKEDSTVILNFGGQRDTSKWYFDDEGALIMDDLAAKGAGDIVRFELVTLTDTLLKLKFLDNGSNSIVIFKPGEK